MKEKHRRCGGVFQSLFINLRHPLTNMTLYDNILGGAKPF